jgi:hypothetical protein
MGCDFALSLKKFPIDGGTDRNAELGGKKTSNTERRTSNIECQTAVAVVPNSAFDVRCWLFDVKIYQAYVRPLFNVRTGSGAGVVLR